MGHPQSDVSQARDQHFRSPYTLSSKYCIQSDVSRSLVAWASAAVVARADLAAILQLQYV